MTTAVIVDAVRTPLGKRNGSLKDWHPVDLAAHTLEALVARTDLDPALVDDVIMGCVMQVGDQAGNVARNAVLAAGFPDTVPGTSVDRQCGSSQQAIHFAAQGVMAGAYDVVIAAGVEHMTRVPMGSSFLPGSLPFGPKVMARYDLVPQGISAEMIAERWGISREENDAFSVRVAPPGGPGPRRGPLRRRRSSRSTVDHRRRDAHLRAGRGHPARLQRGEARPAQARVRARHRGDHRRATRRRSPTAPRRCSS